jgi:hypothetical protein
VEACLYLSKQGYAATQDLLERVSRRYRVVNELSADVDLALLFIYRRPPSHEGAKRMYSLIMMRMPINDSHAKAKEFIKS